MSLARRIAALHPPAASEASLDATADRLFLNFVDGILLLHDVEEVRRLLFRGGGQHIVEAFLAWERF